MKPFRVWYRFIEDGPQGREYARLVSAADSAAAACEAHRLNLDAEEDCPEPIFVTRVEELIYTCTNIERAS